MLSASGLFGELPSGYVFRDISEFGFGWASALTWHDGESTAVWIETPPNNPHLARLVEWDGIFKRTPVPAGVREIACGTFDSVNYTLVSAMIPDASTWDVLGIELCAEREGCRRIPLPSGTIPGMASWDGASDTIWFALCVHPERTPARFFRTFTSEAIKTDRPLPPGFRFPIGIPPSDTVGPCYNALFPKQIAPDGEFDEEIFMSGIIPGTDLDFVVDNNEIFIISGADSLAIKPAGCTRILEIAWASDGKSALVSIFGRPSRVSQLILVRSGD